MIYEIKYKILGFIMIRIKIKQLIFIPKIVSEQQIVESLIDCFDIKQNFHTGLCFDNTIPHFK